MTALFLRNTILVGTEPALNRTRCVKRRVEVSPDTGLASALCV